MINMIAMYAITFMIIANPVQTDKVAHFGLSYAATHSCQVIVKKVFDTTKLTSTLVCSASVLAAGAAKELIDPSIGGQRDGNDFVADALGVGLAVTIISIDW